MIYKYIIYIYKYNLITLGGVNEVVLIVLTSVTNQKLIKSNLSLKSDRFGRRDF
jgi:hypothetical protein